MHRVPHFNLGAPQQLGIQFAGQQPRQGVGFLQDERPDTFEEYRV
jgi:hypothetical protein